MAENDEKPQSKWMTILTKAIVPIVVAIFGSAWIAQGCDSHKTTTFSALVRTVAGDPIPGAHANVAIDGHTPSALITDGEGMFHVEVPKDAKSLDISVHKDGYRPFDLHPDPHQTSAQIIELEIVREPSEATPEKTRKPLPVKKITPAPPLPSGQITQPISPPQPVCGAGVINCNLAPNQGHQDVYLNGKSPAPSAYIQSQSGLQAIELSKISEAYNSTDFRLRDEARKGNQIILSPGTQVTFRANEDFTNPSFRVTCDRPCEPTVAYIENEMGGGLMSASPIRLSSVATHEMSSSFFISFSVPTGTLNSEESVVLRLRSWDRTDIKVLSVVGENK